eukprot:jgi/Bigna1/82649/fgenesh1_pg.95_\
MASEGVKSVDMPLIAMELSATLALWLPIRQLRQRILSVNARAMEAFSALLHQASLAANAPTGTIARGILPQGFYCPDTTEIYTCPNNGSYCPGRQSSLELCPPSHFCTTSTTIQSCPEPENQTSCVVGYYCPAGSDSLNQCPVGFVCKNTSVAIRQVDRCYVVDNKGGRGDGCPENQVCPAGSFSETPCRRGFYCNVTSGVQTACSVGQYCPEGVTEPSLCDAGYVCPTPSERTACIDSLFCPEGTSQSAPCPNGYFCPNATIKIGCSLGQYCESGATSPSNCTAGSYCPNPNQEVPCNAGQYCPTGCLFVLMIVLYFTCTSKAAKKTFRTLLKDTLIITAGIVGDVLNYATDIATFVNIVLANSQLSNYVYPVIVVLIIGGLATLFSVWENAKELLRLHDQASTETGAGNITKGLEPEEQLVAMALGKTHYPKLGEMFPEFHAVYDKKAASACAPKKNKEWSEVFEVLLKPYNAYVGKDEVVDPDEIPPRLTDSLMKGIIRYHRERHLLSTDVSLLVLQAIPMFVLTAGPIMQEASIEDVRSFTFRFSLLLGAAVIGAKLSLGTHYYRLEAMEHRLKKAVYSVCLATYLGCFLPPEDDIGSPSKAHVRGQSRAISRGAMSRAKLHAQDSKQKQQQQQQQQPGGGRGEVGFTSSGLPKSPIIHIDAKEERHHMQNMRKGLHRGRMSPGESSAQSSRSSRSSRGAAGRARSRKHSPPSRPRARSVLNIIVDTISDAFGTMSRKLSSERSRRANPLEPGFFDPPPGTDSSSTEAAAASHYHPHLHHQHNNWQKEKGGARTGSSRRASFLPATISSMATASPISMVRIKKRGGEKKGDDNDTDGRREVVKAQKGNRDERAGGGKADEIVANVNILMDGRASPAARGIMTTGEVLCDNEGNNTTASRNRRVVKIEASPLENVSNPILYHDDLGPLGLQETIFDDSFRRRGGGGGEDEDVEGGNLSRAGSRESRSDGEGRRSSDGIKDSFIPDTCTNSAGDRQQAPSPYREFPAHAAQLATARKRCSTADLRALREVYEIAYMQHQQQIHREEKEGNAVASSKQRVVAQAKRILEVQHAVEKRMVGDKKWEKCFVRLLRFAPSPHHHRAILLYGPSIHKLHEAVAAMRAGNHPKFDEGMGSLAGIVDVEIVSTSLKSMQNLRGTNGESAERLRCCIVGVDAQKVWCNIEFRSVSEREADTQDMHRFINSIRDNIRLYQAIGGYF